MEEARRQGLEAVGVEPSRWSVQVAQQHGLEVVEGVLPHPALEDRLFDAATLIDVIEHVPNPVDLLRHCAERLRPGGGLLVVTPDVRSLVARLMGSRWWHYRLAHIGYFDRETLARALAEAGFVLVSIARPAWFFEVSYLYARLRRYLPLPPHERLPRCLFSRLLETRVPINFADSLGVIARKS